MTNKYTVFAEIICQSVQPEQAAEFYSLEFNRAGFAVCPFHAEKTASFRIHKGRFKCFGCGWGGNVIDFTRTLFGLGFIDTLTKINNDFSVGLPFDRKIKLTERRNIQRRQREIATERKMRETNKFLNDLRREVVWREWHELDQNRTEYAPKTECDFDDLHPLFLRSLREITYTEYLIDNLPRNEV